MSRAVYPLIVITSLAGAGLLVLPRVLHPATTLEKRPAVPDIVLAQPPAPLLPAATTEASAASLAEPTRSPACAEGMQLVDGAFCPFVAHKCARRKADTGTCLEFEPEVLCEGTVHSQRFCIDTFEYPNLAGMKPVVLVSFDEAKQACSLESKRLCSVDEWQFACEGEAILPLPTGVTRDSSCNVDQADPPPLLSRVRTTDAYASEIARLDGRVPSGSKPACTSPFGVLDMSGNVAEWAENPLGGDIEKPFHSAVLGGSFGGLEARCRTADLGTPKTVRSHRTGFRCCSDAAPRENGQRPMQSYKAPGGFRPIVGLRAKR